MINFVKTKSYNQGGRVMKSLFKFFAIIMMFAIAGCSSAYKTTTTDDIYYIPQTARGGETSQLSHPEGGKTVEVVNETASYSQPVSGTYVEHETTAYEGNAYHYAGDQPVNDTTEYYYDEDGNVVINNNYYYGDYYDFAYSSRIRRFHRPYASFGYYDPFFTNMYFYMHNPHYYGVSIYMGYGAMPYYYPGYFAFSPWYSSWYWNPFFWHRGFHPFGYWGSSYWAGYHAGYYAGMYNPYGYGYWGHYNYNYNSHDGSNYHYGPRGSMGSTVDRSSTGRYTESAASRESFAERFEARTTVNEDGRREIIADATDHRVTAAPQASGRESADVTSQRPAEARAHERVRELADEQQSREAYQPGRSIESYQTPARERYDRSTEPRYSRPQQASPDRQTPDRSTNYTMPRTYTSPSYQQPSSPQRTRPAQTTTRPPAETRPSREQTAPQQRPAQQPQRPAAQPTRTDRGQPSYTPPPSRQPSRSTTSPARTTPPRSTAAPARSTPPRSTASPARSTPSRGSSTPARSSSSSSSSSRSSSSGGRNR